MLKDPLHDGIPETALAWHASDGAALATVVETWGSAPRPVGSQLAVGADGRFEGSVSGGCVEGAVIEEAAEAMCAGVAKVLEFGVADEDAFAVGLACGGRIRILVDPVDRNGGLPLAVLEELVKRRSNREPAALLINFSNWEHVLSDGRSGPLRERVAERMRRDSSGFEDDWFVNIHNPPLRMIVVGGAHIAQPLVVMARQTGYDVTVIDPRESFASESRFPDVRLFNGWPDEVIADQRPDARTAVVTLTHDPKIDDPAIVETLRSDAFYLGCLGSVRTHRKRLDRLHAQGVASEATSRIHAPVGLDIGARSPSEIAVAIMGQVTESLRRGGRRQ